MSQITPAWLKAELKKEGRSQSALGRHMGLHPTAINRLVKGQREIKLRDAQSIQQYLDATANGEALAWTPAETSIRSAPDGRVTLDIKANVSMGVAAQILALIEGDKP